MESKVKAFFAKGKNIIQKDHMTQRVFMIVVLAIICLCFAFINAPKVAYFPLTPHEKLSVEAPLMRGDVLEQRFKVEGDTPPNMIGFELDYGNRNVSSKYTVELRDENKNLLCLVDFNGEAVKEGPIYLGLPAGADVRGEQLTLTLTNEAQEEGNALSPVIEPADESTAATLTINGNVVDGQLSMHTGYAYKSGNVWLLSMIVMGAGIFCILFWNQKLSRSIVMMLLIFGVLFCILTPILDTPDEQVHFAKSLMMSNGDLMQSTPEGNEITASYQDIYNDMRHTLANSTLHNRAISEETITTTEGITQFFLGFIPQGIALALAKGLHMDILPAFYFGRILNLILYAVLAFLAVKMVKRFKLFLAAISLMPMALFISGSYNPDAFIYGICLILIAYFINLYFDRAKKITYKQILIFAVLCVLISIKKYNYAPFAFLLFFIPHERFTSRKTKYLGGLLTFALVAVSVIAVFAATSVGLAGEGSSLVAGSENEMGANLYAQLQFAIANKGAVFPMLLSSIIEQLGGTLQQLFTFGWLTYSTPSIVSLAYFAFIAVVAFSYTRYEYDQKNTIGYTKVSVGNRIGILFVMLAIIVVSYLMMYLTWTPVGAMDILGTQGRYFVPVFLLLPFIGQNISPLVSKNSYERTNYNIMFVAMMFIVFSILKVVAEYY